MIRIDPTVSSQTKTGGIFGYALTGGIASLSMKSVLPNATARIRANTSKPVFYFYFDEANARYAQNAASGVWLRSEEHTSELQSLMRTSYAVFCLKQKNERPN